MKNKTILANNITKNEIRNFGIAIGLILLLIGTIFYWKAKISYHIFMILGFVFLALSIIIPNILKPIYFLWMIIAKVSEWLMTRMILSLLFYIVITPISLIAKLFGNYFLDLEWNRINGSYWNIHPLKKSISKDYEKQY